MKLRSRRVIGGGDQPLVEECFVSEEVSVIDSPPPSTATNAYRRRLRSASKKSKDLVNQVPELRRAGSSTVSFAPTVVSSSDEEFFDDDELFMEESSAASASDKSGNALYRMVVIQLECLFTNFYWNGLPWEGMQCRSAKAGLSGVFFALPALLVPHMHPYEQAWWFLQATTSVLADYTYVHTRSAWHGIDRVVAQLSLLGMISRAIFHVQLWAVSILVGTAVACFAAATKAKDENNIQKWHWMHFLWHINAPVSTVIGVYLSHACPAQNVHELFQLACQT